MACHFLLGPRHQLSRRVSLGVFSAALLVAFEVRAEQLVVVDADYTHGPATTKDSHFYVVVPQGTPANWKSPVNYAGGQAVVQLEVKTKPSDAETRFQVCFISKPDYSCTDQSPVYTKTGTVTWTTSFSKFYIGNNGSVDWAQGAKDISLILKDTHNVKPAPENVGAETAALYMPTDLHVIVTLVPEGETYVPPGNSAGGSAGGAAGASGAAGSGGVGGTGGHAGSDGGIAGTAPEVAGSSSGGAPAMQVPDPLPSAGTAPATAGSAGLSSGPENLDEGCACRAAHGSSGGSAALLLAALAWLRRRRTT